MGRPVELQGGHITIPNKILKTEPATAKFIGSGIQQVDPALALARDNPNKMQQKFDNYEAYIVACIAKAQGSSYWTYTLLIKEKSWVKSTEGIKKV